jgi:hypothetical protein
MCGLHAGHLPRIRVRQPLPRIQCLLVPTGPAGQPHSLPAGVLHPAARDGEVDEHDAERDGGDDADGGGGERDGGAV